MSATVTKFVERFQDNGGTSLTLARNYLVTISAPDPLGDWIVLSDSRVPHKGAALGTTGLVADYPQIKLHDADSRLVYLVTVQYNRPELLNVDITKKKKQELKPWELPVQVDISSGTVETVCYEDVASHLPIVNSAGEPFQTPVTTARAFMKYSLRRNTLTYDPSMAASYIGTTNTGNITYQGLNIPAHQGKLLGWGASRDMYYDANENLTYYWKESIEIEISYDSYIETKVLDVGFNELDMDTMKLTPIKDKDGKQLSTPQLLDGHGKAKSADADPVYLTYDVVPSEDWGGIFS